MFKSENFLLTFYAPSPPPSPRRPGLRSQGYFGGVGGEGKGKSGRLKSPLPMKGEMFIYLREAQ